MLVKHGSKAVALMGNVFDSVHLYARATSEALYKFKTGPDSSAGLGELGIDAADAQGLEEVEVCGGKSDDANNIRFYQVAKLLQRKHPEELPYKEKTFGHCVAIDEKARIGRDYAVFNGAVVHSAEYIDREAGCSIELTAEWRALAELTAAVRQHGSTNSRGREWLAASEEAELTGDRSRLEAAQVELSARLSTNSTNLALQEWQAASEEAELTGDRSRLEAALLEMSAQQSTKSTSDKDHSVSCRYAGQGCYLKFTSKETESQHVYDALRRPRYGCKYVPADELAEKAAKREAKAAKRKRRREPKSAPKPAVQPKISFKPPPKPQSDDDFA
jgi:hypothetical protein